MKKLMETIKKARTNERSRTWAAGKPIRKFPEDLQIRQLPWGK